MKNLLANKSYKFIFEHSSDAILLTKTDGSIHLANPAACSMLHRTAQEICQIGRNGVVDLQDPRLVTALQERDSHGNVRCELNFVRADGVKIPVEITSNVLTDKEDSHWNVMIIRDMTVYKELEESYKRSHEQALQMCVLDFLTGIYNRRGFMERLQQELERSKRDGLQISIIIADLDNFKQVNDVYGHLAGDYVLKQFADCLNQNVRPYDILARFGGDEFIIGLPGTGLLEATNVAERLRSISENLVITVDFQAIDLTASFGVTAFRKDVQDDLDTLISRADDAMYKAKKTKNAVFAKE